MPLPASSTSGKPLYRPPFRGRSDGCAPGELGFTLTELVLVISILAIIVGVGAPRFIGSLEFRERFYADEVRTALGYGQSLAVASGCEVEVTLTGAGYSLKQRSACTSGAFTQDVLHPTTGATGYSKAPPAGVALSSDVTPAIFDPLGRIRNSGGSVVDITVSIGSRSLSGIGETGFVE